MYFLSEVCAECHECNRCNLLVAVDLSPDFFPWIATLYNGTCMGIILTTGLLNEFLLNAV